MNILKLTEVQKHRLREALRDSSEVLREIKQHRLSGEALIDMKLLEESVQGLEALLLEK